MSDAFIPLYQRIAQSLAAELPEGWAEARIEARLLDGITELEARYVDRTGKSQPVYAGDDATPAFEALRAAMALPDRGAWYTARFTLRADGAYDATFDYDGKPAFAEEPAAQWFIDDLKAFPRAAGLVPQWVPRGR
jgi:hypothetical protein